jgi:hypothetical protein
VRRILTIDAQNPGAKTAEKSGELAAGDVFRIAPCCWDTPALVQMSFSS